MVQPNGVLQSGSDIVHSMHAAVTHAGSGGGRTLWRRSDVPRREVGRHPAADAARCEGRSSGGGLSFDADEVWRLIEKHKVNAFTVVGDAMAKPLLDAYLAGSYDSSSVWSISSHAALFSHSLKQQYVETFPNVFITDVIGSSESGGTGLGVVSKGSDHSQGPRVKFSAHAALIDDAGKLVEPKPGAVGRMARTGHVPIGYYKDPAKTETIFVEVDGTRYVVPGDYARYEDDGTVTLLGRGSECVNTYPAAKKYAADYADLAEPAR